MKRGVRKLVSNATTKAKHSRQELVKSLIRKPVEKTHIVTSTDESNEEAQQSQSRNFKVLNSLTGHSFTRKPLAHTTSTEKSDADLRSTTKHSREASIRLDQKHSSKKQHKHKNSLSQKKKSSEEKEAQQQNEVLFSKQQNQPKRKRIWSQKDLDRTERMVTIHTQSAIGSEETSSSTQTENTPNLDQTLSSDQVIESLIRYSVNRKDLHYRSKSKEKTQKHAVKGLKRPLETAKKLLDKKFIKQATLSDDDKTFDPLEQELQNLTSINSSKYVDMQDVAVIAIDNSGASFLDDAISVLPDHSIVVFIADPSAYIRKGDELWQYAFERMESMYIENSSTSFLLPLQALRKLTLSDREPNLCIAVNLTKRTIFRAKIRPVCRFDFDRIDKILQNTDRNDPYHMLIQNLYRQYSSGRAGHFSRSESSNMLRFFMNRTNSIATQFVISNRLSHYVIWNQQEQAIKLSSPLRRFSDWITQEVIISYLEQHEAKEQFFKSGELNELDIETWFTSPYTKQEISEIQSEYTEYLNYTDDMDFSQKSYSFLQHMESMNNERILGKIVQVGPRFSLVELVSNTKGTEAKHRVKVHLVNAQEAEYLQLLEKIRNGPSSDKEVQRKRDDIIPGAFVVLKIKKLDVVTGTVLLEHQWREPIIAPLFR